MSKVIEPYVKVITPGNSKFKSSVVAMKLKDGYILIVDKDLNVLNIDNLPGDILISDDGTILVQDYNAPDIPYASSEVAGLVKIGDGLKISDLGVLRVANVLKLITDATQTIEGEIVFNQLPTSSETPTKEDQLVTKAYVDNHSIQVDIEPIGDIYSDDDVKNKLNELINKVRRPQ